MPSNIFATKPYKYPLPSRRVAPPRSIPLATFGDTDEDLTGWVNGIKATDLEERVARELRLRQLEFIFQFDVRQPGRVYDNSIDFVVTHFGNPKAVEIFGQFSHGDTISAKDAKRIAELNAVLEQQGIAPIAVIFYFDIETPEMTRDKLQEVFF